MNSNDGMVMWLLGGAGIFLMYAAHKNQQPQALLAAHINGTPADAPISNYTSATVPTITGPDGKTHNTAPGDGPYITTEPPSSKLEPGYNDSPYMLGGFGTRQDITGTHNVVDASGRMVAVVPATYQDKPSLYIHQGV